MIRGIAIGGVVGCMLAVLAADIDTQARATYCVAIAAFLIVLTLTPRTEPCPTARVLDEEPQP